MEGKRSERVGEGTAGRGLGGLGGERGWGLPTDSPDPLEEARFHRMTLGFIYGFTQTSLPPDSNPSFQG